MLKCINKLKNIICVVLSIVNCNNNFINNL